RPKPGPARRSALPGSGGSTSDGAARAGLAGNAAPAGGALILGAEAVGKAAEEAGLFVWITDDEPAGAAARDG
ncbi:MAG: DUF1009 domain-containing protein, partial [Oceanicaulis sp.]|nr:DUF1009 domain-containing protein [Oceanicaulis sp.]